MSVLKAFFAGAQGMRRAFSVFAPYIGAGVKVEYIAEDFSEARVSMSLRWYNTNYVGTHFGGSLYSMVDPFFMLLLMNRLGRDYIVWDKAASIDFIRPGKGKVSARFVLTDDMLNEVTRHTANGEKYLPVWPVEIVDEQGELVARVDKTLYIRRKQARGILTPPPAEK
jgi:acyl-coenzyme A thioesterase PaaI-like protein